MKLLRDSVLMRALRRVLSGRAEAVRRPRTVTVPAPLKQPAGNNVIELHRKTVAAGSRSLASIHAQDDALPSSVHLALVSSR